MCAALSWLVMETHQSQGTEGSFKLLRNFLGTIAGGLSSLASIPFGKRKKPEDPVLIEASADPHTGFEQTGNNWSKLYPDMELSETRKRARLSLDGVPRDEGECSKEKCVDVKGLGETSEEVQIAGETLDECEVTPFQHDNSGADKTLGDYDVTALGFNGVSHGVNMTLSGRDELLHDLGEDFDENLASFKKALLARKTKQQKRAQDLLKEDIPNKKVRFGNPALGFSSDDQFNPGAHTLSMDIMPKKGTLNTKRKRVDDVEDKNEKKLRALSLSEKPVRTEGKMSTSTIGMAGVSTRKRERVDVDSALMKTDDEEVKLRKVVFVENLPLNATRKDISKEFSQFGATESMHLQSVFFQDEKTRRKPISGEIDKTANSQNALIVFKDELSAKAALAHNMKEFNGNCLRVVAARAHGPLKGTGSAALDDAWSIFVSNTPVDVKDEELYHLFGSGGSLKLDVKAVRVTRDPHSGLSKGTAYVFFKTEADVNHLLSSRRTLKLRDRVLRVSRISVNTQAEQRLTPPRLAKRSINSEVDESSLREKRVKVSLPHEAITTSKGLVHQGKQTLTRSKRSDLSTEEYISSSHVYSTRQVAASRGQSKSMEDSLEAKRKRVEKHQRGISRSKKIRRT